jgi:hypothetical protein
MKPLPPLYSSRCDENQPAHQQQGCACQSQCTLMSDSRNPTDIYPKPCFFHSRINRSFLAQVVFFLKASLPQQPSHVFCPVSYIDILRLRGIMTNNDPVPGQNPQKSFSQNRSQGSVAKHQKYSSMPCLHHEEDEALTGKQL